MKPGRHPIRRARGLVLAGLIAALMLAGCGIGPQTEPGAIDLDLESRRIDLGERDDPPSGPAAVSFTATIYLVGADDLLVPVARQLRSAPARDAQLDAVLGSLVEGPTDGETAEGLRSAIPPTVAVRGVTVDGEAATVDLSSTFAAIGGISELTAVGQVALTATTFPGVRRLTVALEGTPTAVPLPDGALADRPVTIADFGPLLGPADVSG